MIEETGPAEGTRHRVGGTSGDQRLDRTETVGGASRADLDTIREVLEKTAGGAVSSQSTAVALAALDRLAGCVILTREEAEQLRAGVEAHRKGRLDSSYYDNAALLDARLGAAAEETKP